MPVSAEILRIGAATTAKEEAEDDRDAGAAAVHELGVGPLDAVVGLSASGVTPYTVGALAESQGHHPDIHLAWGKVKVELWTHKVGGLTESDFVLAAKIDRLAGRGP